MLNVSAQQQNLTSFGRKLLVIKLNCVSYNHFEQLFFDHSDRSHAHIESESTVIAVSTAFSIRPRAPSVSIVLSDCR